MAALVYQLICCLPEQERQHPSRQGEIHHHVEECARGSCEPIPPQRYFRHSGCTLREAGFFRASVFQLRRALAVRLSGKSISVKC